jgi:hypothetical protein
MEVLEIRGIESGRMINALHMEFTVDRLNLFERFGPDTLKIRPQFDVFKLWAGHEDTSYRWVIKSFETEQKAGADHTRDSTLTGIGEGVVFSLRSSNAAVVEAARRVKILLDTYNKPVPIKNLPYDAETAAITNLLQELKGPYAGYVQQLGLTTWVTDLEAQNLAFAQLADVYHEEQTLRPEYTLKEARRGVDHAYAAIVKRLSAWIELEGETWRPFVNDLNVLITHYHDILAQHLGRVHSKKQKAEDA